MKQHLKRGLVLTMACLLFVSMALSVSAAGLAATGGAMSVELENGPEAGVVTSTEISGLPFSMSAKNVTSFLSSQAAGKGFVPRNYQGKTIWIRGTLYHSEPGGSIIRSGICYFNAKEGKYIPGAYRDVGSGQYFAVNDQADALVQGTTYYGYIRNNVSHGAVNNGTIWVDIE